MNKDRGMIKWMPFNSLMNGRIIVNNLLDEKSKIKMPILSDDEIGEIENNIINAYYTQNKIIITYYKNGYLLKTKSLIKKIDYTRKIIYLDNNINLLFRQITNIILG
ncbi:MAG: YolD-like family protein [Bacilli bacterium]